MFDFTTENVLNDLSRVSATAGVSLNILRLNRFLKNLTGKVYKRASNTAVKEVSTITIPAGTYAAGVYRLNLDVQMRGSYPITYDRWAINKGKPFYIEFYAPASGTATILSTALVAGFKKGLIKYNGQSIKDFTITGSGATIVLTAGNEYQRFVGATLELQDPASVDGNFNVVTTGVVTTAGKEGFGDAWYLTKNVRIPTQEATRFFGEDQDERPVSGSTYNQYTFEYTADRNFTGQSAVGQKIQSKTTHVLWVPSTLATTFEAAVTSAFGADSILDAITKASVNP